MVITFITGNLKDCLMKELIILKHLIMEFTSYLSYYDINKIKVEFNGGCLKQDQSIIPLKGIVNIYIVYEITSDYNISDYPALKNCLFGALKLIKNADIDKS